MARSPLAFIIVALFCVCYAYAQDKTDSSPHTVQYITVEPDVKLEVLDWGGEGRPLVFLAGLGDTAHVFDSFAPAFTSHFHVYGITRRGFGLSSKPTATRANYTADRLGDDVLAVIHALNLDRPVLIGHSLAGEELSSIGSRHPEEISGLVYLDAAHGYAFYDHARGDLILDTVDLEKRINALTAGAAETRQFMADLLTSVSQLQSDLQKAESQQVGLPEPPASQPPPPPLILAIVMGTQKYTTLRIPILAFFACPPNFGQAFSDNPKAREVMVKNATETCSAQSLAFEHAIPSARVIRLPDADHYIFRSNQADVLAAMNDFLAHLP